MKIIKYYVNEVTGIMYEVQKMPITGSVLVRTEKGLKAILTSPQAFKDLYGHLIFVGDL